MKVRFRFTKTGSMKFIGHLDCMRFFQKAIRRAGLDVAYSQGYSPHQLMSFASPLGLGLTSDGEYLDVEFASLPDMGEEELIAYMNRFMTDEIFVKEMQIMPDTFKNSMSLLCAADYMVAEKEPGIFPSELEKKWEEFLAQEKIVVTKKTKKSEKTIDIRPFILQEACSLSEFAKKTGEEYGELHSPYHQKALFLQLTSGSETNIKPELVMDAFFSFMGQEYDIYALQVHRLQMYFKDITSKPGMENESV